MANFQPGQIVQTIPQVASNGIQASPQIGIVVENQDVWVQPYSGAPEYIDSSEAGTYIWVNFYTDAALTNLAKNPVLILNSAVELAG